jgi:2-amino-4-hydroxy-6-hydroxymethyldihydropteridine diphosphokinase
VAQRYLIALGSNQRHHRHGPPERVLLAALEAMGQAGIKLKRAGPVIRSAPLGPSLRRYANSAAVVKTKLDPEEMLAALKTVERAFGRKRGGQRWGSRVLDLDIVLWSGGAWASSGLTIPHPRFRERQFVLGPAASIAPDWRDPLTRLTLRQLAYRLSAAASRPARLTRPGTHPSWAAWSGP